MVNLKKVDRLNARIEWLRLKISAYQSELEWLLTSPLPISAQSTRAPWTDDAIALAKSGDWTLQQIADRYSVTRERVRQVLAANGVNIKDHRGRNHKAEVA